MNKEQKVPKKETIFAFKTYRVASVDVSVGLQVFKNLFEVASAGGPQKTCIVIRLKKKEKIIRSDG